MKTRIKFLFILLINLIIVIGCANKNTNFIRGPRVGVRLMHKVNNNIHILEWRVWNEPENMSEIKFENGDIINYEIRSHKSNETITNINNKEMTDTITLKPGEEYKTSIKLHNDSLEKGKYDADFWAKAKGGEYRMSIHFIVE